MAQSRTMSRLVRVGAAACASAVLLAGCGDGEDGQDSDMVDVGSGCEVEVSADTATAPQVSVPDCDPPGDLFTHDVVEGEGSEASAGDTVTVQYAGFNWSDGEQFDASWDRGAEPFEVAPLGSAPVIQGWNDGLIGAQVGDRRLMVIPPELGYGEAGAGGGAIGPNETLVFVIDVVGIS